jgi:hypothetical protein
VALARAGAEPTKAPGMKAAAEPARAARITRRCIVLLFGYTCFQSLCLYVLYRSLFKFHSLFSWKLSLLELRVVKGVSTPTGYHQQGPGPGGCQGSRAGCQRCAAFTAAVLRPRAARQFARRWGARRGGARGVPEGKPILLATAHLPVAPQPPPRCPVRCVHACVLAAHRCVYTASYPCAEMPITERREGGKEGQRQGRGRGGRGADAGRARGTRQAQVCACRALPPAVVCALMLRPVWVVAFVLCCCRRCHSPQPQVTL